MLPVPIRLFGTMIYRLDFNLTITILNSPQPVVGSKKCVRFPIGKIRNESRFILSLVSARLMSFLFGHNIRKQLDVNLYMGQQHFRLDFHNIADCEYP